MGSYSTTFLANFVTRLRGAKRSKNGIRRLLSPAITRAFLCLRPLKPTRATVAPSIIERLSILDGKISPRVKNGVFVAPGQRQVTETPLPLTSSASPSEKIRTNALDAAYNDSMGIA